jgi:RNA polymerase sigma-70 factor (ECF subfamily)
MEFESDEALTQVVERGGAAGAQAVTILYHRTLPRVYSLCRRYFAVREDAEEATSEALLRALRALSAGQYRGDSRYLTWLLRIASNVCIERLRQPRLPTLSLDSLSSLGDVHEPLAPEPSSSDQQVLAITLCDLEGYTAREAAEIMGRSPEAMKSLHYRARRALRDRLREWQKSDRLT